MVVVDPRSKTRDSHRMQDVVIVSAVRTPLGRLRGGLSQVRPDDLLAVVLRHAQRAASIEPHDVEEVFAGCANQAGEDNRNVARMASLLAGFPYEVPAITVNRLCASGLDAVVAAARAIAVGDREVVLAGGVESMTRAPLVMAKDPTPFASGNRRVYDSSLGWRFENPKLAARFPLESMGETAENIAEATGISRQAQDAFALRSHSLALAAWERGDFADEVIAVDTSGLGGSGQPQRCARDEGPRQDTSVEKLARLPPVFRSSGTVTAGNASTLNDGAAALCLMSARRAKALGIEPVARFVAAHSSGVDPRFMGLGPVAATRSVLERVAWRVADLDLIELNEAFAVVALAVMQELQLPQDKVNVQGGAIALGHPLGCSGARILTTLVHAMRRRRVARGLATLCVGVGQGVSVLVER